jgi:ribosomal protein S18 acetylase RimI-like enzyme
VRRALSQLSAGDRLVLILSFGADRSHADIAEWLGVPISTVARRLAHAKRRMRNQALDAFSGGLRSRDRRSVEEFVIELSTRRVAPPAPPCAYVVEDPASGTPMACASATQTIYRPVYDLRLAMGEDAVRRHAGDVLLSQVVKDMVACDAISLQHRTSARHAHIVSFLLSRGFEIVERAQDWRLPPSAMPAARTEERDFRHIRELSDDASMFEAALQLLTQAIQDDPAERIFLPIHPDGLRRTLRQQQDGVLAIENGNLCGLLAVSADEVVPEATRINMLLVAASERRRGLATAMLRHALARQGSASARLVARTGPELSAWLIARGFSQVADTLVLERLLRKTVKVPSPVLDAYAGRYLAARPDVSVVIERHGHSLISKSRDMRDVLLASSETEFFTRHHYGHGRFERDADGQVVRLVYVEGLHEIVAIRTGSFPATA